MNTQSRYPLHLPSPESSSLSSLKNISDSGLPTPRTHPLKSGSQKEVIFVNYVDSKILRIHRRYAKKFSSDKAEDAETDEQASGYDHFEQVVLDLEQVLDAVWVSGTPGFQVAYLLAMAGVVTDFLPSFPFDEAPTVRVIEKLDWAFASLLRSGGASNYVVPITARVRIRSVIERTRVAAVEVATKRHSVQNPQHILDTPTDTAEEDSTQSEMEDNPDNREDPELLDMGISTIYERSLSILGDSLG